MNDFIEASLFALIIILVSALGMYLALGTPLDF